MRDAIDILLPKLAKVIHNLAVFAEKYKDVPTLGFTHMQPGTLISTKEVQVPKGGLLQLIYSPKSIIHY